MFQQFALARTGIRFFLSFFLLLTTKKNKKGMGGLKTNSTIGEQSFFLRSLERGQDGRARDTGFDATVAI
jgi:hypothetical protein